MKQDLKDAMVRLAVAAGTVAADFEARMAGRGGYLHPRAECLEKFINSKVRQFRSLRHGIARTDRIRIAAAITERLDRNGSVE